MAFAEITALLGGWPGFELIDVRREEADAAHATPRIVLTLQALPGSPKTCSRCGQSVTAVHDVSPREVRDLPILEAETWLVLPRARVQCPRCGPTVEAVPWLDRYQRMTTRLAESIARLCQALPLTDVAAWYHVGWDAVKQIDARALARRLGPVDLRDVRVIAIDEFALHRGHRYATVVADPRTKRVLWVGPGRDRAALDAFLTRLGVAGRARLEAAVMDMSQSYTNELRAQCPQAAIVYDCFHVMAAYGTAVVDRVRVDEMNRLGRALPRGNPGRVRRAAARRVYWGARWLLLRNRAHLTRSADRIRLRELLRANRALFIVYVLKEDLQQLWRYRSVAAARRFWREWDRRARASKLAPLIRFAEFLARHIDGVLNHCRFPLNNGFLEGMMNKIKVLKRRAYGFRDDNYFFLKIRAAFPGIPG
ncbi:MAG TPA: ISL3 family transposase [Gemmatimonadaceae bacterium]